VKHLQGHTFNDEERKKIETCRKRADALHGKNLSFKSQAINCFDVFITIIGSKIMAYLISVLLSN